ncbi:SPW repeat protein [Bradyrhizobium diazoefficiens]|uniref:SPW repeat protein n=1 Tax=Bradyrhizobium diazoefficiens TaxID=1355477 RepID=UPI00190A80F8|nr:SPW repeat protein [Bradyrhizobium diazoefficiens]QQO14740.1 SPW repeat protein [Bradyrhizobium diazoefficiens]
MNTSLRKELIPDVLNLLLGAGLFVSPWVFGFSNETTAGWNAWISGFAIAVLAIAALAMFAEWEEWLALAIGVWVAASPWLVHFSANAIATPLHVIAGMIVAAVAAVRLWYAHGGYPHVTA